MLGAASGGATSPWHALTPEAALEKAGATEAGLTKPEAAARLLKYGANSMTPGRSRTLLQMVWEQLYNLITGVLLAAAIVEGVFQEYVEVGFILAVIVANLVLGVYQEGRAEAATKAIAAMVSAQAIALRNGRKISVPASQLVPGDVVSLTAGDRVPADMRILDSSNLQVTEAMLTGESVPVSKSVMPCSRDDAVLGDRTTMLFTGTLVFTGSCSALVVETGDRAEIGRINALMAAVEATKTPLLVQIEGFGFGLSVLCIVVALVSFFVAYFARSLSLNDAFKAAVSVAVSLIPEGLPAVVTITLSLGVQAMARAKAIVKQLPAVETLGSVTCICSDKTGTLTKNEMTAVSVHTSGGGVVRVTGAGYNPEGYPKRGDNDEPLGSAERQILSQLLLPAALCNDATLMPVFSAHAQHMYISQPITLQQLQHLQPQRATIPADVAPLQAENDASTTIIAVRRESSGGSGNDGDRVPPPSPSLSGRWASAFDAAVVLPHGTSTPAISLNEVNTAEVGVSIVAAMTTPARLVEWDTTGDPTEAALLALVMKTGLNLRTLNLLSQDCPVLASLPFTSENKFMATIVDIAAPTAASAAPIHRRRLLFVKGAPDVLLPRCSLQALGEDAWANEPIDHARWAAVNISLAREGMRVLALCVKELPAGEGGVSSSSATGNVICTSEDVLSGPASLQLNCLVAIVDPPREEAVRAIRDCHSAGVGVKMITGDHAATALTIGGWLGIETDEVLTGPALEKMSDEELGRRVEGCNIYARASPEHKLRIVRALQAHGHVVAMTGDGVNDAPALRQADCGVAMGVAGTEVAKEAARMILLDDNFAVLEAAVRRGRGVYDNLRKLLAFILPTSFAQGISIAIAVFMGIPAPLTAIQILWVNVATACTLGLVLAAEEPEKDVMTRPPRRQGKSLVGKQITWRTVFVGTLMIVAMLVQQGWTLSQGRSRNAGHTAAMNTLVVSQAFYVLSCRSLTRSSVSFEAVTGNPWLTGMAVLNGALQCLITYVPALQRIWSTEEMDGVDWLRVLLFAILIFLLVEAEKRWGPALIRPYVMPAMKRINAVVCRKGGGGPHVGPGAPR